MSDEEREADIYRIQRPTVRELIQQMRERLEGKNSTKGDGGE